MLRICETDDGYNGNTRYFVLQYLIHNTKLVIQQYINLFIIKTKENIKIGTLFPPLLEKIERQKALLDRIK